MPTTRHAFKCARCGAKFLFMGGEGDTPHACPRRSCPGLNNELRRDLRPLDMLEEVNGLSTYGDTYDRLRPFPSTSLVLEPIKVLDRQHGEG